MGTLEDLYLQFEPLVPLAAEDPRYVDTAQVRGVRALHVQLSTPLVSPGTTALFFSGHLGDGKTTLLKHLEGRLEADGYFVAYGEADKRLNVNDFTTEDVLLAILAILDQALRRRYGADVESGPLARIADRLLNVLRTSADELRIQGKVSPFVTLTTTLREAADERLKVRKELREARRPTFFDIVNEYLDRAREIVEKKGHRRAVVILDNLDRAPPISAADRALSDERLLLGPAVELLGLRCPVIYVVRLALIHANSAQLSERYGTRPVVVPMIAVRCRDGTSHGEGLRTLERVLEKRCREAGLEPEAAFAEGAAEALCRASGGHLRDLMVLVQQTCMQCLSGPGQLPLTAAHAQAAIREMRIDRRRAILDVRQALEQIGRSHDLADVSKDVRQTVLSQRMVYEYLDEEGLWYDVAPLCEGR